MKNLVRAKPGQAGTGAKGAAREAQSARKSSANTACTLTLTVLALALSACHSTPAADAVATVNGHAILRADLDKVYNQQLGDAQQGQPQEQPSREQADSLRLGLLSELISEEIVQQRAAKMNLTASNEEVDAKLAEMKAPYTEEQFDERLRERHTTIADIQRDLRRTLTINKLLNKEINSKVTVSDADIAAYYGQHKEEFNNRDNLFRISQILVTSAPAPRTGNLQGSKAQSEAEARKKIQALKNRVDSGEDFGSLAMNFSEDPQTAASGGDRGLIPEEQLRSNPIIFEAISKLKPGQATDIIPFPDPQDAKKIAAYVILQLVSKELAGQHNLAEPEVQQKIRQGLHDTRSTLLKNAYFEMLRDQAKVQNFFAEQIFKADAH